MGTEEKQSPREPLRADMNKDTVYYYSREHRLSRASDSVQELNNGKGNKSNFLKTLFGIRGNRMLIFAVILAFSAYGIANRLSSRNSEIRLGGNNITAEIIREDGVLTLDMDKNVQKNSGAYSGPVDMAVSPVMSKSQEIPPIFTQRIFFSESTSESFSFILPFEGTNFFIVMRTDEEQLSIKLPAKESKK